MNIKRLFLSACLSTLLLQNVAYAGKEGGGGDMLADEFVARGHVVLAALHQSSESILSDDEIALFSQTISKIAVYSTDEVLTDKNSQHEVDAINYLNADGTRTIYLNRTRVLALANKQEWFDRLVFHEYLRAMGKDDENYVISYKLAEVLDAIQMRKAQLVANPKYDDNEGLVAQECGLIKGRGPFGKIKFLYHVEDGKLKSHDVRVKGQWLKIAQINYDVSQALNSNQTLEIGGDVSSLSTVVDFNDWGSLTLKLGAVDGRPSLTTVFFSDAEDQYSSFFRCEPLPFSG